jgi:hypothetical protein
MSCAPIPPPDVLSKIDEVRMATATQKAKKAAPTAFARGEKLRADAQQAFDDGDSAAAQILGEQSLAAYGEAVALARVARADEDAVRTSAEGDAAQTRLAELETEHQKVAADIAALELRLRVLKDAEPVVGSGSAQPEQQRARHEAARAMSLQARLVCSAAQLLLRAKPDAKIPDELTRAEALLKELDALIATKPAVAPIDHATRARARCLEALTSVRKLAAREQQPGAADSLLAALSEAEVGAPRRDERGVVVTLRGVFDGSTLSPSGKAAVASLSKIVKSHPSMPVMVVLHAQRGLDDRGRTREQARGAAFTKLLAEQLGREVPPAEIADNALPVVDPRGSHRARNERVDVVLVTRLPL